MQPQPSQLIRAPFLSAPAEVKKFELRSGYYLLEVVLDDGHHTFKCLRITAEQLARIQVLERNPVALTADAEDFFYLIEAHRIRVLKEKEIKQYGEYRTRRLVLEARERLEASSERRIGSGERLVRADSSLELEQPPASPSQSSQSDFGLYKCEGRGKLVLGFDKEGHIRTRHNGEGHGFVRL